MGNGQYAFKRGWSQVKNGDIRECKRELMEALGITTRASFLQRLKGTVEPKVSEAAAIEGIFAKYGVTEVWGE